MQTEQYRGPITNRGLTTSLSMRDGCGTIGNVDLLGLDLPELVGKKILDVGMGGGRTLKHALELGLDCYGVDILPLIDTTSLDPAKKNVVIEQLAAYSEVQREFPSRVKAANFCSTDIPYTYDEFDVVFSAVALPDYARSTEEAEIAILNMICLAKEHVDFHCGWNPNVNHLGYVTLGTMPGLFQFEMKKFLDKLETLIGIQYILDIPTKEDANQLTTNIHLNTKNKRFTSLQTLYMEYMTSSELIDHPLSSSHSPLVAV